MSHLFGLPVLYSCFCRTTELQAIYGYSLSVSGVVTFGPAGCVAAQLVLNPRWFESRISLYRIRSHICLVRTECFDHF